MKSPARGSAAPAGLHGQGEDQRSPAARHTRPGQHAADVKLAYARSGGFGLGQLWGSEACVRWPGNGSEDRYTGPWHRRTASPILLVGITGDTQVPYRDDLAMAHDLARARLLTVRGYGHTEIANPSTCATNYELSYLQTGALPPAGTACQQDVTPFPAP